MSRRASGSASCASTRRQLGTLDAIHLATALLIKDELKAVITYDVRLARAARAHDLAVVTPG